MPTLLSHPKATYLFVLWLIVVLFLSACVAPAATPMQPTEEHHDEHTGKEAALALPELAPLQLTSGEKVRVVTTLNLLGDVVAQVGGDHIELTTLLPVGADPHGYAATPADLRAITDAHVIFLIGGGLEESLEPVLTTPEGQAAVISVNSGLELLALAEGEEHAGAGDEHGHGGGDPHTWTSVRNVQHWVETIEHTLSTLDPANAATYQANAAAYDSELASLEEEISSALAAIPAAKRKLVTDHEVFGYFAHDYGFTVVGSVVPGLSTLATPSAQELAALQDQIQVEGVQAIFVGNTVNPGLAEQLATDLGIQIVPLYTESLSAVDGPAASYPDFMRYNVQAIAAALQ